MAIDGQACSGSRVESELLDIGDGLEGEARAEQRDAEAVEAVKTHITGQRECHMPHAESIQEAPSSTCGTRHTG